MPSESLPEPHTLPHSPRQAEPETPPGPGSPGTPPDADRTAPHQHAEMPGTEVQVGVPDVSGFDIVGELARGGMGVVYAARDLTLGREVAVKTILPHLSADSKYAAQFARESRLTAVLSHPGVPPIHATGTLPDGRPFLAMRLIRGRTISEELATADRDGQRPRLLGVFEQVCQTVGYAHSVGLIHRDLKPGNVMVGAFGEVQVMDWGLAKVLASGGREPAVADEEQCPDDPTTTDATVRGRAKGTPAFMPPEQARGEWDAVDARADVFALGGILSVVLTGQPPFSGKDSAEVMQRAAAGDLTDAFARLDGCGADAELTDLCKRCLAPNPDGRPRDGRVVAEAVAAYRAGVEERVRRAETERAAAEAETREQRKRRKVQLALAGTLGLLLLGGGAFAWWQKQKDEEATLKEVQFQGEQRAQQARFEGEQQEQAKNARERTTNLLELASVLRTDYRFGDADNALQQAGVLAGRFAQDLVPRVEQAKADLEFVRELDRIWTRRSTWIAEPGGKGGYDTGGAAEAYRKAFLARGLDVAADPVVVGDRVAASQVRTYLVSALDDWAIQLPDTESELREKVLAAVRRADPDSGANPFRDPAVWKDLDRLKALLAKADISRMSPEAIAVLAAHRRLDPIPTLRHAISLYPRSFPLAFYLGQALFLRNRFDPEAIGALRAARALRPDNIAVLMNLSYSLSDTGDVPGAIAACHEVIRLDPKFTMAQNNLGNALLESGNVAGAIAAFREQIRLDPNDPRSHNNIGIALSRSGDLPGAIAAYKEAIRVDPKFVHSHLNLSRLLLLSDDVKGAIAAGEQAIRLAPTSAAVHANMGIARHRSGDVSGAIAAYKEAIRLDPKVGEAYSGLGRALQDSGDLPRALEMLLEAVTVAPEDAERRYELATFLYHSGRLLEAVEANRHATRLDPKFALAHAGLGQLLYESNDLPGAIAACREAIRLDPKLAVAHNNLGNVLIHTGDVPGALKATREAVSLDPNDALFRTNLGRALHASRDPKGAIAAYRHAIRMDPKLAKAHINLSVVLQSTGDLAGAIECLKEAVRLEPKDPVTQYRLGYASHAFGNRPEAIAAYGQAVALDPGYPEAHCNLGLVLQAEGRLDEALPLLRRGHELGTKRPGWKYPSAKWVAECERLLAEQKDKVAPPPRPVRP